METIPTQTKLTECIIQRRENEKVKKIKVKECYFSIFLNLCINFILDSICLHRVGEEESDISCPFSKRCAKCPGNIEHTGEFGDLLIHCSGAQ